MSDQVHQVSRIFAIVNSEGCIESNPFRVLSQEAGANAVKRARPNEGIGQNGRIVAQDLARDPLYSARHLCGRSSRESHQQYAVRIGTVDDQVRDAMGECVGLAGAGTGDNEEGTRECVRPHAMLDGAALRGI